MALRDPAAKLSVFTYAGVFCVIGSGRGCAAHGLPATPDTFYYIPLVGGPGASIQSAIWESWDGTSFVIVNSQSTAIRGQVFAQTIWSPQL